MVQESLTNTLKHASPPTDAPLSATVTLTYTPTHLDARITDTGTGISTSTGMGTAPDGRDTPAPTPAQGIMGMRERAALYNGTIEAGPLPAHGGWHIHLRLPLEDHPQ